jgi:hypothetical protein
MGLPAAPVDICNMALDLLGQPPVASIDPPENTVAAKLVARHYDAARQTVLRKYVWNFAKKRTSCARTGTPAFDFADMYAMPNDFLRLLSIEGDTEIQKTMDYDIQGKEILANASGASSIKLRYIADIEDVNKWDALFRNIVVLTIALNCGYQLTKQKSVVERIDALLKLELPDAVSIDGQEVPPKRIQTSKSIIRRMTQSAGVASKFTITP